MTLEIYSDKLNWFPHEALQGKSMCQRQTRRKCSCLQILLLVTLAFRTYRSCVDSQLPKVLLVRSSGHPFGISNLNWIERFLSICCLYSTLEQSCAYKMVASCCKTVVPDEKKFWTMYESNLWWRWVKTEVLIPLERWKVCFLWAGCITVTSKLGQRLSSVLFGLVLAQILIKGKGYFEKNMVIISVEIRQ